MTITAISVMKLFGTFFLFFTINAATAQIVRVTDWGALPNSFSDVTLAVQKAIEVCRSQNSSILYFPKGRYDFWPDDATETHYYISNTSSEKEVPIKKQRVGLFLKHLKNITVEGNGSEFVFHGKMISWVIDSSENIHFKNLSINYERPGMSEITIQEATPTQVIAKVHPDSRFSIIDGRLEWYGEKWVAKNFHAVLVKPKSSMFLYSNWDNFYQSKAESTNWNAVKFSGNFSSFQGQPGDVLTIRDHYRDYVGAFHNQSQNVALTNVHMISMHGLGIVSQFTENINYDSVWVTPASGSGRVISSSADGIHFSGCKGQIVINHCRFKGMHDDPVNIHGTHLIIHEIIPPKKLKLRFMHPQTYGFAAFAKGDSVAWVHANSLQIFGAGVVAQAQPINEREIIIEMQQPLDEDVKAGDAVENITWTPSVTIRNSRFEGTNTRGTLVTTRRKVIIENNIYYRIGMQAILIENDASGWYESGAVTDVLIRNNQFIECGYNLGADNFVIAIRPHAHSITPRYYVHKNIRIENNMFKVYDYPVLFAHSTQRLVFSGNTIQSSNFLRSAGKRASFQLTACADVYIGKNIFERKNPFIQIEKMDKRNVNTGLSIVDKSH